eukprot:TRINITY_DN314_c1_g1_i2.p1 TRINITY_DN314_c1_g1~~TRINITY_DN314_c1_g1_i2.p1  ORF type:complete len:452 (-),score=72.82 TRINITY_DN314_c1_g1_i2:12-1367(-)
MKCISAVPSRFLLKLANNEELYMKCPLEVKRQIWEVEETLFSNEIMPLIRQYIKINQLDLRKVMDLTITIRNPKNRRNSNEILKKLVSMIGNCYKLYMILIETVKEIYYETKDVGLCTLRNDLLMGLYDNEVLEVYSKDPCHKLCILIDSILREGRIASRKLGDIFISLDELSSASNNNDITADIAMIFRNPYIVSQLVRSVWERLSRVLNDDKLPRADKELKRLVHLLHFGFQDDESLKMNNFGQLAPPDSILKRFYPSLGLNVISHELNQEVYMDQGIIKDVFRNDESSRKVILHYCLTRLRAKDTRTVELIIDLMEDYPEIDSEYPFFACFFEMLIEYQSSSEKGASECANQAVEHIINCPGVSNLSSVHKEMIRYILATYNSLPLETVLEYIQNLISNLRRTGTKLEFLNESKIKKQYLILMKRFGTSINNEDTNFIRTCLADHTDQ